MTLSVWSRKNLKKLSPLCNTLFQFDSKIENTYKISVETTSILALWQKLRTQMNYFHYRPLNRLSNQLNIIQSYSYQVKCTNMLYCGSNTPRPLLFANIKKVLKIQFFSHRKSSLFKFYPGSCIKTTPQPPPKYEGIFVIVLSQAFGI